MTQTTSTPQRKLAAIMFTDIVGYSRIMSLDESKAFKLLDQHDKILHAIIDEHQGKVLKKMGDAFFIEFASSVSAVNCATCKSFEHLAQFGQ
ncbi:MAG: adenylate/guanylate cyclase domain-containing protein [Candidatus Marinimicrobia bacterium]|nr:adenylate/guanylate cyclase domain-containing protein [Candidatus Neomarinimicrobiota bacterium]